MSILLIPLLLFFAFSFLYSSDNSFNQDLGRHIKFGEIIWQTWSVPTTNLFSYTYPNFPFVNHHWLFGVLVYLASISIGLQAVLMIKVLIILTAITITLILAKRIKSVFFFSAGYFFLHLMRGRIDLRPEIFSFLFTAITLYVLDKFAKTHTRLVYILPFISLAWVNTHIYFPVGIFLQAIFLGDFLFRYFAKKQKELREKIRTLGLVFLASLVCICLNPNFIVGALYPFNVFRNYGVTITENQTIATLQKIGFVNPDFFFFYWCIFFIIVTFFIGVIRNKITLQNVGVLLLGIGLALQSIRGFPYVFLLCFPMILQYIDFNRKNIWVVFGNVLVCLVLLVESFYYLNGLYYQLTYKDATPALIVTEDAKDAMDFVVEKKLPQPIFNNFDFGSYILYRTYPDYKVFIDGRPEAYPATFFTQKYLPMQEEYKLFKQKEKEYKFQTVIFAITDQNPRTLNFLRSIIKDPDWKTVYLDRAMIVLVKSDKIATYRLSPIQLEKLNVQKYVYSDVVAYTNLSTFLFNMNQFTKAQEMNEKALQLSPDNPAANRIMANILIRAEKPNLPLVNSYLEKAKGKIFW